MSAPEVIRTEQLAENAAALIAEYGKRAIAERGIFRLALAGGSTPGAAYRLLAEDPQGLDLAKVQFTFGDERCVPPDHADSNYRMARETLLDKATVPEGNVFRIRGEIDPEAAAVECEAQLKAVAARFGEKVYRHDLLLLGMGEDGHTASLFPGYPALDVKDRWLVPTLGPKPPPQRVTFTYLLIDAARCVCFLTNIKGKAEVLERVLAGDRAFPAARVNPTDGTVIWMIGESR